MSSSQVEHSKPERIATDLAGLPLWMWWLAAFAFIVLRQWLTAGAGLADNLGDMDDAARLVEVREFMAGQSWFDMWTNRMGGDAGMLSHWSRLIDAPIALLLWACGLFVNNATAEIITRAVWPLMVLAPLLFVMASSCEALSGRAGALIALALAAMCPLGLYQYNPGRIDHHNVMITATLSAALILAAFPQSVPRWRLAGGLCALALAIGYEALAPVAAMSIAIALWGLYDREKAAAAHGYVEVFSIAFAACFVLTAPPSRWLDVRCDAISLNMVLLALAGGIGASLGLRQRAHSSFAQALALTTVGGGVGVIAYGWLEPKCLAGPLGQLPRELNDIWFVTIGENRSILADALHGNFDQSLSLLAYYGLGVVGAVGHWNRSRTAHNALLAAFSVMFAMLACWQYKYTSYASFFLTIPIAMGIASLKAVGEIGEATVRACATVLVSQALLLQVSHALDARMHAATRVASAATVAPEACLKTSAIRDLAELPPGLIAARIDLGAYIVAITGHRALSAPYHRIANAIIANHHIFAAHSAPQAAALLRTWNVDYVVTCSGLDDPFVSAPQWQKTLRADLVAGAAPAFLLPVQLSNPNSLFKVWRVDRSQLAAASP